MCAQLHSFLFGFFNRYGSTVVRLDKIDRAVRTAGRNHIYVEIDFSTPIVLPRTTLGVVALLPFLIVFVEVRLRQIVMTAVHRKVRSDIRVIVRIDDRDDLSGAFGRRREIIGRLDISRAPSRLLALTALV